MSEETILLKDLIDLVNNKSKYLQNTEKTHNSEGMQGEYNEKVLFYKHPGLPEGVVMREIYRIDSYGYDDTLTKIDFVIGKEKVITVYEPM